MRVGEALMLQLLGATTQLEGDLEEARDCYAESSTICAEVGDLRLLSTGLGYRAIAELELGDLEASRAHFEAACKVATDVGEHWHGALFRGYLGALEALEGRAEWGAPHFERALARLAAHPHPKIEASVSVLAALPEGSSPPPRPVLVQGSGAAVFLLDAYQCAPGDDDPACAGDATTTGGDATTDGEDTSTGGEDTSTGSGTGSTGEPDATTAGDMTDGSTGAATGPSGGTNSDGATTTGGGDLDGSESDGCACRANDERPGAPLLCLLPVLLASRRRW